MYRLLFTLYLLTIAVSCDHHYAPKKESKRKMPVIYEFENDSLVKITEYYDLEKKNFSKIYYLKNQFLDSTFVEFNIDGNIIRKSEMQKDMRNGLHQEFYKNGNKKIFEMYKNDTLHGPSIHYFNSGEVMKKMTYDRGELSDEFITYSAHGHIISYAFYWEGIMRYNVEFSKIGDITKEEGRAFVVVFLRSDSITSGENVRISGLLFTPPHIDSMNLNMSGRINDAVFEKQYRFKAPFNRRNRFLFEENVIDTGGFVWKGEVQIYSSDKKVKKNYSLKIPVHVSAGLNTVKK